MDIKIRKAKRIKTIPTGNLTETGNTVLRIAIKSSPDEVSNRRYASAEFAKINKINKINKTNIILCIWQTPPIIISPVKKKYNL